LLSVDIEKRKVEITNNEKSKAYETEKRKRIFIPSWMTTYPWLQNGISRMTCTVCTKFDKTGTLQMFDRSDTCPHLPDLLSDRQERDFDSSEHDMIYFLV
jgi:hypothetical protein